MTKYPVGQVLYSKRDLNLNLTSGWKIIPEGTTAKVVPTPFKREDETWLSIQVSMSESLQLTYRNQKLEADWTNQEPQPHPTLWERILQ